LTHVWQTKKERQATLEKTYQFKCNCEACENDYPVYSGLKVRDGKFVKYSLNESEELQDLAKTALLKPHEIWKKYRDYCQKSNESLSNMSKQPSHDVTQLQMFIPAFLYRIVDATFKFPS